MLNKLLRLFRSHWAVENSLHWVLDVTLREEDSRVRKDHAPENMAMVRHIILNELQNTKKKFKDMSIRRLQKKAGRGYSTLDMILMAAL
ncbi:transposase family protein [Legionella sp. km535]|uniref:transposase family protein n=1 Tax=Legionella sp. km535 TaxID=2498107 RepID=UPI000F8E9D6D|nr:transposase family protein [Legionella sp. km535]